MAAAITSRKNEIVREFLRLSGSSRCRRETGAFSAEGARLCADAAESGLKILRLLTTEDAEERYGKYLSAIRRSFPAEYRVTPSVAAALSDTKQPQGVFCVVSLPEESADFPDPGTDGRILVLENIRDPANLGAVLRTAEALGVNGAIFGGSCCDAFSAKSLRAGMGAVFRLRCRSCPDTAEAVLALNRSGYRTFAAVPSARAVPVTRLDFTPPCAVVIGNEGNGLTEAAKASCTMPVTIPMLGRAESLNAASSAAILMWEMMRKDSGGECSK